MGKDKKNKESPPPPISEISFDPSESDDVEDLEFMNPRHMPSPTKEKKLINISPLPGATANENRPPSEAIKFKMSQLTAPPVTAKQPNPQAISKMVDHWFPKADLKTTTIADIYKAVEDHFQVKLSRANRKLVRGRLKELCSEEVQKRLRLDGSGSTLDHSTTLGSQLTNGANTTDSIAALSTITDANESKASTVQSGVSFTFGAKTGGPTESAPAKQFSALSAKEKLAVVGVKHDLPDTPFIIDNADKPCVLRFKNIYFEQLGGGPSKSSSTNASSTNRKQVLKDITGNVKEGNIMAVIGPSDSGKSTLINVVTLEAFYGKATGVITLNGVAITDRLLRRYAYMMRKDDRHWPYLTCRESLVYAAQFYGVKGGEGLGVIVDSLLEKVDLTACADVRCSQLTLLQVRLLSLGMAALKKPSLLFMDEPTTGLDGATACKFMQAVKRIATTEKVIVLCSIQVPTAKVYDELDLVVLLSKGREAYVGEGKNAQSYFSRNGSHCPPNISPVEYFLDMLSVDAHGDEVVDEVLELWNEKKIDPKRPSFKTLNTLNEEEDGRNGVKVRTPLGLCDGVSALMERQGKMILRDPILYMGRGILLLVSNILFAVVYWKARVATQDQLWNKVFLNLWLIGLPSSLGGLAVWQLNAEFSTILRETRNGMVAPLSYILVKTVLVLPILPLFAFLAVALPGFALQGFSGFGMGLALFTCCLFVMESIAECVSVWFEKASTGMVVYATIWAVSFLFGGILLPFDDMIWPFKAFYYMSPLPYFFRSFLYTTMIDVEFQRCNITPDNIASSGGFCIDSVVGADILDGLSGPFPLVSSEDSVTEDIISLLVLGVIYKIIYAVGVLVRTGRASRILGSSRAAETP